MRLFWSMFNVSTVLLLKTAVAKYSCHYYFDATKFIVNAVSLLVWNLIRKKRSSFNICSTLGSYSCPEKLVYGPSNFECSPKTYLLLLPKWTWTNPETQFKIVCNLFNLNIFGKFDPTCLVYKHVYKHI